jgi:PRTRC genetic system protein B
LDYFPVFEIAVFEAEAHGESHHHALVADLRQGPSGTVRGPWRDLSEGDVVAMRKAFSTMGGASSWGLIPEQVLSLKPGGCCWWAKAARRPLHLTESLAASCGLPTQAECNWPALLFVSDQFSLRCYALPENRRPGPDTEILPAPLWNMYLNGGVCLGSARIERGAGEGAREHILDAENAFFLSQFSHLIGADERMKGMKLHEAWLIAQDKPFPTERIISSGTTLATLLTDLNF